MILTIIIIGVKGNLRPLLSSNIDAQMLDYDNYWGNEGPIPRWVRGKPVRLSAVAPFDKLRAGPFDYAQGRQLTVGGWRLL